MDAADAEAVTTLNVSVQNVGRQLQGDEVVQLFLVPKKVPLLKQHPIKTLIDFVRLHDIGPQQTAHAVFEITQAQLLLATEDGHLASVPGVYELSVENGAGAVLVKSLAIAGEEWVVVVPFPAVAPKQ
eukprot:SAG22_NODE_10374_length_539_cov_0.522727_1_plen_128_part_00